MAFDPAFLDELRARTPIAAVVGRRTKLIRSGRNWKACCPFHGEKTPSFTVYDDGFHCFGCGAHGDVISFVMQTAGQSFPETVAALAAEAGLELPRQDPGARERAEAQARHGRTLESALAAAQRFYVGRLRSAEGAAGLAYLRGRGLGDATIESFGLGWSGDGRGLGPVLEREGFGAALMAEAGLMRLDDAGRPKGELFFNRVTFPIRDRSGGLISFGGRTLSEAPPKYLNGPETALFSKRLTLFALDRAAAALRAPQQGASRLPGKLIVVEGYVDVIAMHQAELVGAVAPLGTALTAGQFEALWRLSPAPVLCFDGDAAGRRAAIRAAQTALPLLDRERSLAFCRMPEGEDPDSLLRRQGARGMEALIGAARPLSDVLFELLSEGVRDPGPEQRAALHARLVEAASLIGDRTLAGEYRHTLLDRYYKTFRPRKNSASTIRAPVVRLASGPRATPKPDLIRRERLRILTAILLRHPELLHDVEEAYCSLDLPEDLHLLRRCMIDWCSASEPCEGSGTDAKMSMTPHHARDLLDSQALMDHLSQVGLEAPMRAILGCEPLPLREQVEPTDMPAALERRWWHYFGLLNVDRLEQEKLAALQDWIDRKDETSERRLRALSEACVALGAGEQADDE